MAQLQSVDPANLPGPANNRNAKLTTFVVQDCPELPEWMTGQLWPRGQGA